MPSRRGYRSTRKKRSVSWDIMELANQVDLPSLAFTNAVSLDGGQTALRRYVGTDLLIRRTVGGLLLDVDVGHATGPTVNTVLSICVGLGIYDEPTSVDGQAVNSLVNAGAGPLSDANNNRWYLRCCVDIPLGRDMTRAAGGANGYVRPVGLGPYSGSITLLRVGASASSYAIYCEFDTKAIRKLHGIETKWINVAMEALIYGTALPAGDTVDIVMNNFSARHVLQFLR